MTVLTFSGGERMFVTARYRLFVWRWARALRRRRFMRLRAVDGSEVYVNPSQVQMARPSVLVTASNQEQGHE